MAFLRSDPAILLRSFIKHGLFWLLFFAVNRAVFLIYNQHEWQSLPVTEVLYSFVAALGLDLSQTSYFMAFTFAFFLLYAIVQRNWLLQINTVINCLLIVVSVVIYVAELPVYDEWHNKLNRKAVLYLQHPAEVISSATAAQLAGGIAAIILLAGCFMFVYIRAVRLRARLGKMHWYVPVAGVLVFPFLIAVGIRGGLQQIPIQQSSAYYSRLNFLNLASVNSVWNLGQSFFENRYDDGTNPYTTMPDPEATRIVADLLHTSGGELTHILDTARPNVVLVLLESWSADMLRPLGGYDSVAPNLSLMAEDGLLFTRMFSSGTLSDQGHCSVLSGFPSQPGVVLLRQPDKFQKLPSIVSHFRENGYYTAYYFGGDLSYGNIRGYVYYNRFDRITEGKDFGPGIPSGKLGYHDEFLFARMLSELPQIKQPFFTTAFTMSSHSPYDYPGQHQNFAWGGTQNMYINGVHYSDSCIGAFMREARKQAWYRNTLFVFVSDHSHPTPRNTSFHDPESRRIVCFLYGEPLRQEFRRHRVHTTCNHHDLPATLLPQLGGDASRFTWSRNILSRNAKSFGFSADDYIIYFYEPGNAYTFRYTDKYFLYKRFAGPVDSARVVRQGSAYVQKLYDDYLTY